jgi:transposase-like protein
VVVAELTKVIEFSYTVVATQPTRRDPMTKPTIDATQTASNVIQTSHASLMLQTLLRALTTVMDGEVSALCGAGLGERSEGRTNSRNGYRERPLETRMGTLELQIPKLRQGSYFPSFLEPRRRWEQAFVSVVSEAYVQGVSTRKVDELVKAMGAGGMSKSEVSRLCQVLDEEVEAFRKRKLDKAYPYLWLDAIYLKVREGQHVVSKATLVAYGVSETGEREVIGVEVADGEMEDAWRSFLAGLVSRGLRGVRLVISDAHAGLVAGVRGVLNGVAWQRCTVHFMRNVLSRVPKAAQGFVAAALKGIFSQTSQKEAKGALRRAAELLRPKYPAAAAIIQEAEEEVLAYMSFPEKHWRQIHSTNPLERQNREIRRRTDVVGIFPNGASVLRLVVMLLVEQNDDWAVSRRYFSLESMQQVLQPASSAPEMTVLEAA